jgi:tripartite-type tricarboxylate transporter receptor subunit TctC
VVNKAGAGSQVGLTEFVMKSKPDGYTVALTNFPATSTVYLDPRRQAAFSRKAFLPLAFHAEDVLGLGVRADTPWKSVKEVFEYVKANPLKLKTSTSGLLSPAHVSEVLMEKEFGLKFTIVHFDGGAAEGKALLDGSVDVGVATIGSAYGAHIRNGEVRALGIATKAPSEIWPGVPTWESQGYPFTASSSRGLALPAGTPKEIVEVWSAALRKAMASEDTKKKMAVAGMTVRYMSPEEFARFWDEQDAMLKPIVAEAAKDK